MTMGRGTGEPAVAGGPAHHIPVLSRQVTAFINPHADGVYVDATFGGGGHTRALLAEPKVHVIGIDRDPQAIARAFDLVEAAQGRLVLTADRFSQLDVIAQSLGHQTVDGIVLDLGVSSMQLDAAERGFSFRLEGPLDMRMGDAGPSAADVVARASERTLADIIGQLGEERHARAVARAIVAARRVAPIQTTQALAEIVSRVVRAPRGEIHPATRSFQALRIFVNDELGELVDGLADAERILKPEGRLVVVAFHSLEDRIVKNFVAERSRAPALSRHQPQIAAPASTFRILTRRPETPDESEVAANPRARSAKLRAAERTDAPARASSPSALLPRLPSLADVLRGRP